MTTRLNAIDKLFRSTFKKSVYAGSAFSELMMVSAITNELGARMMVMERCEVGENYYTVAVQDNKLFSVKDFLVWFETNRVLTHSDMKMNAYYEQSSIELILCYEVRPEVEVRTVTPIKAKVTPAEREKKVKKPQTQISEEWRSAGRLLAEQFNGPVWGHISSAIRDKAEEIHAGRYIDEDENEPRKEAIGEVGRYGQERVFFDDQEGRYNMSHGERRIAQSFMKELIETRQSRARMKGKQMRRSDSMDGNPDLEELVEDY